MDDVSPGWQTLDLADPQFFSRLRLREGCRVLLRFRMGIQDHHVGVPALSLLIQGQIQVEPNVERFAINWIETEPVVIWLARRRGRGRPDYWQGYIERVTENVPLLVLSFTAKPDDLILQIEGADDRGSA